MSLEIPIILVDRYGAPLAKLDRSLEGVRRKTDGIHKSSVKGYGDMGRSLSDLRGRLERYKRGAEESFNTRHIKRYNALIGETQKRIQAIERETKTCSQTTEGMFSKLKNNMGMGGMMLGAVAARFECLAAKVVVVGVEDVLKARPLCRQVKSSNATEQRSVS